jgi:hypothetical protein
VPDDNDLATAYALFARSHQAEQIVKDELKKLNGIAVEVPPDLAQRVRRHLVQHPKVRWDAAVQAILAADRGSHRRRSPARPRSARAPKPRTTSRGPSGRGGAGNAGGRRGQP